MQFSYGIFLWHILMTYSYAIYYAARGLLFGRHPRGKISKRGRDYKMLAGDFGFLLRLLTSASASEQS